MNIYIYNNTQNNYCTGHWYFAANNREEANKISYKFEYKHNENEGFKPAYSIRFKFVRALTIFQGYLNLR